MKFRGKTVDVTNIQFLTKVIGTVARLTKTCTLRLTTEKMYFISLEHRMVGGVGVWCEIFQAHVFDEYLMEGVNLQTANEIYLSVNPDNLVKCFKCSQSAKSLKLKLARKGVPCLTVEVDQPTAFGTSRKVVHDVSVSLVERKNWIDFSEPQLPEFEISICMPPIKIMKNVIERMKNLSDYVTIAANYAGEMVFKIEKDVVTVSTHFEGLSYPHCTSSQSRLTGTSSKDFIEAQVDIKKLSHLLSGQQMNPTKIICSIASDQLIHVVMLTEGVSLQYLLPSISL